MATHAQNIKNLEDAVYGEQVRRSMIELFEEDFNLVKKGFSVGTEINSPSSSREGYYEGCIYINSETLDIWKMDAYGWNNEGNLKGILDITSTDVLTDGAINTITITLTDGTTKELSVKNGDGIADIVGTDSRTDGAINTITVTLTNGQTRTFTVKNGNTGVSVSDAVDNGDGSFYLTKTDGTRTSSVQTIKGEKGETGATGAQGLKGDTGNGLTSITSTDTGNKHLLTANYTDGTSSIICTVKDGASGESGGDMYTDVYDQNKDGIVDFAEALSDGTSTLTVNQVKNKADKSTTLAGYGITDAIEKPSSATDKQVLSYDAETDKWIPSNQASSDWNDITSKPFATVNVDDFSTNENKLSLSRDVTGKLSKVDESDAYSSTKADYEKGQLVIYNNKVYKALQTVTPAGSIEDSAYWEETSIGAEVSELNNKMLPIQFNISTRVPQYLTIENQSCYIIGSLVYIKITFTTNTTLGATNILTIPSESAGNAGFVGTLFKNDGTYTQMMYKSSNFLYTSASLQAGTYTLCGVYPLIK